MMMTMMKLAHSSFDIIVIAAAEYDNNNVPKAFKGSTLP